MQEALAKLDHTKGEVQHWTASSPLRMVHAISGDFVAQLETRIEEIPGFTHGDLAKRISVSLSRVSQVMNSPGNLTIKNTIVYANGVGGNVALVVYPMDPHSNGAPISGDVFRACWEIAGRPRNMFDIQDNTVGFATTHGGMACIGHVWGNPTIKQGGGTLPDMNCTAKTDCNGIVAAVSVCAPLRGH